jgi:hypothetical protein
MRSIINHENPDIFVVQELGVGIGSLDEPHFLLHKNVFLDHGRPQWKRAAFSRSNNSSIINGAYYNSDKVELKSQNLIVIGSNNLNIVRGIDVYHFYYKDAQLGQNNVDTVFFTCIVAHLKAGSTSNDILQRDYALTAVMNYISQNLGRDNIFIMGDFNMNSSAEAGMQKLVNFSNPGIRFHDPVNALGNWFDNSIFAAYHTQSTRLSQTNNGCFVGGGLDDRYDLILMSDVIKNQEKSVAYVPNSYKTIGQDGLRFNSFLNSTSPVPNTSVPSAVLNALYNNSDHLPVRLDFTVTKQNLNTNKFKSIKSFSFTAVNPISDLLILEVQSQSMGAFTLELSDLTGRIVLNKQLDVISTKQRWEMNTSNLNKGLYIITLRNAKGESLSKKIIKN